MVPGEYWEYQGGMFCKVHACVTTMLEIRNEYEMKLNVSYN